jgi:hypothetical protein
MRATQVAGEDASLRPGAPRQAVLYSHRLRPRLPTLPIPPAPPEGKWDGDHRPSRKDQQDPVTSMFGEDNEPDYANDEGERPAHGGEQPKAGTRFVPQLAPFDELDVPGAAHKKRLAAIWLDEVLQDLMDHNDQIVFEVYDFSQGVGMYKSLKLVAIGGCLALGAAACSSNGSASGGAKPTPIHAVETAYASALSAKTAKVTFTESIKATSASGSKESSTVTGSGAVDLANQGYELTVNSPSGGTVEVLHSKTTEFIQVPPAQRANVPGHLPWESIDLNQVDEAKLGASSAQLASFNSDNPGAVLSNLTGVSNSVTQIGTATIGGTPTTEYRAEVSLSKEAARANAKAGPKAAQAITQEAQALGTDTLPVDVWVDAHGLPRQISEKIPIPAASTGATNGSGSATITMTFSDFGAAVSLTPPPAAQVADITSQVVQQAKASAG